MSQEPYPEELRSYFGLSEDNQNDYKNILVYIEVEANKLLDISLETLGKALELASLIGVKVEAVLFQGNDNLAKELISYGADTVYLGSLTAYNNQKYTDILFNLIQDKKPEIIMFGQTYQSLDFAPRLAQKLKTGLLTNCVQLDIDTNDRLLLGHSLIYNGLLLKEVKIPRQKPQMAMVLEKKFSLPVLDKNKSGELIKI